MTMPGTRAVINGDELIAFAQEGCEECELNSINCADFKRPHCAAILDHPSVIWLTPLNYVARRLTQGTTP